MIKKVLGYVTKTLTALIVLGLAGLWFWAVTSHVSLHPILSGSMEPEIQTGALVAVKPIPKDEIQKEMIVAYRPDGDSISIAHRVKEVSYNDKGNMVITTKGDNNPTPDLKQYVVPDRGISQVIFDVPLMGYVYVYMFSSQGRLVLIGAGGLLVLIAVMAALFGKDEKQEDDNNNIQ